MEIVARFALKQMHRMAWQANDLPPQLPQALLLPSPHLPEAVLSLTQQHGMPARDEHQVRRCWICTIRHCSTRRLTSTRVIYTTRYLLRIGFHVTPAFSPGTGMRAPYMLVRFSN